MSRNLDDIVIVGVSSVLPDSENLQEFWNNLLQGNELISEINREGWGNTFFSESVDDVNKSNSKWLAQCEGFDSFDNSFFNMSPAEADKCDPLQRIGLQEAWKCIEDAAIPLSRLQERRTAVIVGSAITEFFSNPNMDGVEIDHHTISGTCLFFIPNRISNYFGLSGESKFIDTGCSASTVAMGDAVNLLRTNKCDYALVSGINMVKSPYILQAMSKMGLFSKFGKCSTFDSAADGIVLGEGIITFLLTAKQEALKYRNRIYGIIKEISVNHVARTAGLVAPSVQSQYELIKEAWKNLDFDPKTINYVELHGTGTRLGDPIEVEALRKAYMEVTEDKSYCAIGSVKANVGHLLGASGMLGVLKVLKMFEEKMIPKQINVNIVNPLIDIEKSPFVIHMDNAKWLPYDEVSPLRASVSSIGIAGVNSYVVLENCEDQNDEENYKGESEYLFLLSAKSKNSLVKIIEKWANNATQILEKNDLRDVVYTLSVARQHFPYRLGFSISDKEDLIEKLKNISSNDIVDTHRFGRIFPISMFDNIETGQCKQIIANNENLSERLQCIVTKFGQIDRMLSGQLYDFWFRYVVISSVLDIVRNVDAVMLQSEDDLLLTMCVCGGLSVEQVFEYYENGAVQCEIKCSIFNKTIILPNQKRLEAIFLDKDYFNSLLSNLSFDVYSDFFAGDGEDKWLEQMLSLYKYQRAYKKYLQNLSDEVKQYFNVIDFIEKDDIKVSGLKDRVQKFIIFVSLTIARVRLNKKWGINYIYPFRDKRMESICKLVLDEYVSFHEIVSYYENVQTVEDVCYNPKVKCDIKQIAKMVRNELENCQFNQEMCKPQMVLKDDEIETFEKVAFALWKMGIDVDWSACLQVEEGRGISLPTYCFEEKKYKMIYQGNYTVSQENDDAIEMNNLKIKTYRQSEIGSDVEAQPAVCFTNNMREFETDRYSAVINIAEKGCQDKYTIRPDVEEDIYRVLQKLSLKVSLKKVVMAIDSSSYMDMEQCINVSYLLVINFVKALQKMKFDYEVDVLYVFTGFELELYAKALTALFKTIYLENDKVRMRNIYIDDFDKLSYEKVIMCELNKFSNVEYYVYYHENKRFSYEWENSNLVKKESAWENGGVYVIFGGLGGIGKALSRYIGEKTKGNLIICGRREENKEVSSFIQELNSICSTVQYKKADITEKSEVVNLVDWVIKKYGNINGIFNLAAELTQGFLENKNLEYLRNAIKPKVDATLFIDEATSNIDIDFICNFSSISSVIGDYGLCDYVYANAFLDEFTYWRENLRNEGRRTGWTVSINWPYWENGGLSMGEKEQRRFFETTGLHSINNEYALTLLDEILSFRKSGQYCVAWGDAEKIDKYLQQQMFLPVNIQSNVLVKQVDDENKSLRASVEQYFISILSKELKMEPTEIDFKEPFENYGVDSILVHKINRTLVKDIEDISITLFLDNNNLEQVIDYVLDNYSSSSLKKILNIENQNKEELPINRNVGILADKLPESKRKNISNEKDIAVVGMSGRFPKANNLSEYWQNLVAGKNCIFEIPPNRWDWEKYYDENEENSYNGKMYSKWGGFVEDIDKFDPYLFNITPADACKMDPQERMLLEIVYEALECAGYSKTRIRKKLEGDVGVFVGSTINGYRLLVEDEYQKGNYVQHNALNWSISNRISYVFGLNGPSFTIDSACSSSLNAVVDACHYLRSGECRMAIVGGTNLHIHPSEYVLRSQLRMLSPDGKCYSFGENANGYVPGEGIGALILKTLSEAEKDGDLIWGVIKGVATNHVGHPSGYTVPSKKAQSQVICKALNDAKMSSRDISLIEAHGTGTKLGDPIEIGGLVSAFGCSSTEDKWCAISSVKSNIGHLEGASGIAAIIKVLLQLKHKIKVPSIHCEEINKGIFLEKTPFYIQRTVQPWSCADRVLAAGVSSFGAGGSNAHVVVSEYIEKIEDYGGNVQDVPVLFSAYTSESLKNYLQKMKNWLQNRATLGTRQKNIVNIAYTTQVGRELLPYRVAIQCDGIDTLLHEVDNYLSGEESSKLYTSFPEDRKKISAEDRELYEKKAKIAISDNCVTDLIELALKGIEIDWYTYNYAQKGRIINIPTYCFDNERYWIAVEEAKEGWRNAKNQYGLMHLLDENISDVYAQKFVKTFYTEEDLIKDHRINGKILLAGMAQIEMAFEAGKKTFVDSKIKGLSDIHFVKGIVLDEEQDVEIEVECDDLNYFYTVYNSASEICSTGIYKLEDNNEGYEESNAIGCFDVSSMHEVEISEYYETLKTYGFEFGSTFQCIKNIYFNDEFVLGRIAKPQEYRNQDINSYVICPEQVDGALQVVFLLIEKMVNRTDRFIPISLGSIELYHPLSEDVISVAKLNRYSEDEQIYSFDISIYDDNGVLLAEVKKYTLAIVITKMENILPSQLDNETLLKELQKRLKDGKLDTNNLLTLLQV